MRSKSWEGEPFRRLDAPAGNRSNKPEARVRRCRAGHGPALFLSKPRNEKKKPRRNGAKSNGRKYPNGGVALVPESTAYGKVESAGPEAIVAACCSKATFVKAALRQQSEQGRKVVQRHQPVGIDHGHQREHHGCHQSGPDEL